MHILHLYYPGSKFPSLSVTGSYCALRCKHCNGRYLEHMIPVETPEKLMDFVKTHKNKINGFLLSGGSTLQGKVPLKRYTKVIKWIRENTDLKINIHTGIIEDEDMAYLEEMQPHHISFDVIGSTNVIKNVLGTNKRKNDYLHSLDLLDSSTINYSPHLIIGLNFGKIGWEFETIDLISDLKNYSNLVLIVLIPTSGTPMEKVKIHEEDAMDILKYSARKINSKKLVLGCMRPKYMVNLEKLAVDLNFKGIVVPSLKTTKYIIEKNINFDKKDLCCVF